MKIIFKEYGEFIVAVIGGGLGLFAIQALMILVEKYGRLFIWLISGGGAL